jgi:hypothetical protein
LLDGVLQPDNSIKLMNDLVDHQAEVVVR